VGATIYAVSFILSGIAAGVAGPALMLSIAFTVNSLISYWCARPRAGMKRKTKGVLPEQRISRGDQQIYQILVPMANPDSSAVLLFPAIKAAKERGGHIILLYVIVVPDQLPFSAARRFVEDSRPLIKDAAEAIKAEGIPVKVLIRIAHRVALAIIETAIEENVNLLVMGWGGRSHSRFTAIGKNIDRVIDKVGCEILIIQQNNTLPFRNILLPLADPDRTVSALQKAWFLAANEDFTIDVLHVFPPSAEASGREKLISAFQASIARFRNAQGGRAPRIILKTIDESRPVRAIVNASAGFDCLVLSSTRQGWLERKFSNGKMMQIARRIKAPLILAR